MNTLVDKFFPIPDFLRMPAVGLDISDTHITYVELIHTNKGVGVGRYGQKSLEEGVVLKGVVQDIQKLKTILSALQKELNIHFARVAAPEQLVFGFVITIPKVDQREIPAAIEFQIEEHVPVAKKDLIFDYEILSESSRGYHLKVNAVKQQVFESYRTVLGDSNFHLVHFEPKPEASFRGLVVNEDLQNSIVINISKDHSSISIVEDGIIISSASVGFNSGGEGNIDNLGDEITRYYKYWRTKDVKKDVSIQVEDITTPESADSDDKSKLEEKIEDMIDGEGKEVDVVRSMYPIVLCGEVGGLLPSFEQLAKKLDTKVVQGEVWNAPTVESDSKYHISKSKVAQYATAIGLALSDF